MVRGAHLLKAVLFSFLLVSSALGIELRDDFRQLVGLDHPPKRIVSLAPSVTEVLFAVGAGDQVVGVTDFCNRPPEAKEKAKVGGFAKPDLQRVLRLRPDLVIAFGPFQLQVAEALRRKGVAVFWIYPQSLEEILDSFVRIGQITGHRQEGVWLKEAVRRRLELIKRHLKGLGDAQRPRIFRVMGLDPPGTVGGRSFQSSIFRAAGGRNAFEDVPKDFFYIDLKEVLRRSLDVVLICGEDPLRAKEELERRPGWAELQAVRQDRMLVLPCDLICRPGPRVAEAVARIASFLHPSKTFCPRRIVSLVPALTEEIYFLGEEDRLVGVTTYCRRPPEAQKKEKVGTVVEFSVEKVLQLRPDVVLASPLASKRAVERLRRLGVWVEVFPTPRTFGDLCGNFLQLAALLGAEERALEVLRGVKGRMERLGVEVRGERPRVFIQIGANPLFAAGSDSIISEAVRLAGGRNIVEGKTSPYSREAVIRAAPDIILIVTMGVVGERERQAWSKFRGMKAVREGRIYIVDSYLFCSPTPLSFVDAVGLLVRLLHGQG